MKTESNLHPDAPFEINELPDGMAEVMFYDHVEEVTESESAIFKYDLYCVTVPYRDNLAAVIEQSYEAWLNFARSREETPEQQPAVTESEAIAERVALLEDTNKTLHNQLETVMEAIDYILMEV